MLYVARSDGRVLRFDLHAADDVRAWLTLASAADFHANVRSLALAYEGHRADLPMPRRFREVRYEAELVRDVGGRPVAECVSAVLDGVVISLTMYLNGRSGRFRVDLDKRGQRRFRPQP